MKEKKLDYYSGEEVRNKNDQMENLTIFCRS